VALVVRRTRTRYCLPDFARTRPMRPSGRRTQSPMRHALAIVSLGGQSLLKVADGRAPNGAGRDHPAPFVPSIARASREDTRRVLGTRRRWRFARRRNSVVVSPAIPAGQCRPPTMSTGHEAVRITRSATLPINSRRTPVRPRVPMTTRSTRLFLAAHGREQPLEVISILRVSSAHILSAV